MSMQNRRQHAALLYMFLVAGLAGLLLPWILASSGAMTLNAFDLAEWASLHPSQPGTSPPLIVPLLLRVQLVFLALMVGLLAAGGMHRTSAALVIAVFAIAQIPPLEIVYDPNNLNYRQQLIMAMASLILGLAALRLRLGRARIWLIAALALAGMVTSFSGLLQSQALYGQLNQAAGAGIGVWVLCLSYFAVGVVTLMPLVRGRQV